MAGVLEGGGTAFRRRHSLVVRCMAVEVEVVVAAVVVVEAVEFVLC